MQTRQAAKINCDNSEYANKQCLVEPDKFFANMVFTLSFRVKIDNQNLYGFVSLGIITISNGQIGALDSFEKRYKRLTKFITVIRLVKNSQINLAKFHNCRHKQGKSLKECNL